ncbi:hypothetical protein COOONC_22368 [Cooperia oncophora]
MWLILLQAIRYTQSAPVLSPLLEGNDGYLIKEYINAITAYGPGLGRHIPTSTFHMTTFHSLERFLFLERKVLPPNWESLPSTRHKETPATLSHPCTGCVAVPLDEEALHGEPLFPPELVLPWEKKEKGEDNTVEKPTDPFGITSELVEKNGLVSWPNEKLDSSTGELEETKAGK